MKNLLLPVFLITIAHADMCAGIGGGEPLAGFSYYIEYIGFGSEVYFLNESIDGETYYWDFGDGGSSTELNPVHAYPEPGIFIICLTATNDFGSDTYCDTINTYYPPSADFSFTGDPLVIFTDLSTNYPETWDWFFGDGEISSLQNPEHLYLANGEYDVCLSVNNPGGTSYTCKPVLISSYIATTAGFSYLGDPLVSFTDLSTLTPFEWQWDFGDGATGTEQNPEHLYEDNGTYTVCLTATNAGGSDIYCEDVLIDEAIAPPAADFNYLILGLEVAFLDISTNDPFEWNWDFGDGFNSVEQNPVHVYDDAGNFTVCLTATNEGGSDLICKDIFLETGIADQLTGDLIVYPNPADEFLKIKFDGQLNAGRMIIFDLAGRQLISVELGNNIFHQQEIDISDLSGGIYYFELIDDFNIVARSKFCVK